MEQKDNFTADNLAAIKDKVYELEGLLELATLRGEIIDNLKPLILNKLKEVNASFGVESVEEDPVSEDLEVREETAVEEEPLKEEPVYEQDEPLEEEEPVYKHEEPLEEEPVFEQESPMEDEEMEEEEPAVEMEYDQNPMVEVLERAFIEADDDFTATDTVSIYRPLKFCLNDRFRFSRGLFEGDNDRFNKVTETISQFDTYQQAEDWLNSEMGWDNDDPEVIDFLELISIYFEQNR